jgi:hypothetical protein
MDEGRESVVLAAREYKLFLGPERLELQMEKEPVLRWPNATRKTSDGATFVWTRNGRPEAIGCIWRYDDSLGHAFQSLSASNLMAEYAKRPVWFPADKGISLEDFPEAPRPADSGTKRLSQMRELARRLGCRLSEGGQQEDLRLLPSPIYRYKTDGVEVLDGALFAYAQGTDPEVVLVLEAQRRDGHSGWKYALTRRSWFALEADLDGKRIWSVPQTAGSASEIWFQGESQVRIESSSVPRSSAAAPAVVGATSMVVPNRGSDAAPHRQWPDRPAFADCRRRRSTDVARIASCDGR